MSNNGNRILEFLPSDEEAVVSRVLVVVHQLIDEHFPHVEQAGRQFTKTVFSGESERTASIQRPDESADIPNNIDDNLTRVGNQYVTQIALEKSKDLQAGTVNNLPKEAKEKDDSLNEKIKESSATFTDRRFIDRSRTESSTRQTASSTTERTDWPMRLMLALLIAGIIVLTYAFLAA